MKHLGFVVINGVIIWGISLLMQWLCSRAIAGTHFQVGGFATSRLAIATIMGVGATILVCMYLAMCMRMGGCLGPFLAIFGLAIIWGLSAKADLIFTSTTVATNLAQTIYGSVVGAIGLVLWIALADHD